MKRLTLIVAMLTASLVFPSCTTPPHQSVAVVQTLLVAGQAAEGAVSLSAQLYKDHKITAEQARAVIDFYNDKWQPPYRIAVDAAKGDLSTYASPALWELLTQLSTLVNSFTTPKPTP